MNKSENLKEEIEEVLSKKSDKSEIEFDQDILDHMIELSESDESKDDILFGIQEKFGLMKPSLIEKYWKESGLGVSKCYRTRTAEMFNESEGLVTKESWEAEMISGKYLKAIINYRQHYATYYACWHHITLAAALAAIKKQ